jgi:hypothetical protein
MNTNIKNKISQLQRQSKRRIRESDEDDSSILNEEDGQPIEEEIFVEVEGGNNSSEDDIEDDAEHFSPQTGVPSNLPRSASTCPQL